MKILAKESLTREILTLLRALRCIEIFRDERKSSDICYAELACWWLILPMQAVLTKIRLSQIYLFI
jgi:hypothetical protein